MEPEDDDAGGARRVMPADIGEVEVQRHQCPVFANCRRQKRFVGGAAEALLLRRRDIMAGGVQQLPRNGGQILVELQRLQESDGTGTIRSRARSAA